MAVLAISPFAVAYLSGALPMVMQKTILIVDDNEQIYKSLNLNFRQRDFACRWAKNGQQAIEAVGGGGISAVLLDLSLGAEDGIEVMRSLLAIRPALPVIIITGFGTFDAAVKAIKLGAYDFLPKPLEFGKLYAAVMSSMNIADAAGGPSSNRIVPIVTQSREIQALCKKAHQLANSDIPVLIIGESGTGKELIASLIHYSSPRRDMPFLRINCSAFAESLVDNELFGHERGAFTGAVQPHPGLFEQADSGTLHLDEIGDMSLATQAKILRVIEEAVVRRIGGIRDNKINVRLIASTNKSLEGLIERGLFRQDLYYRLNAVTLRVPPLRERQGDVPILLDHFLKEFSTGETAGSFSEGAVEILSSYSWPGNIRELRNLVKVCALISESDVIDADDLPEYVRLPASSRSGRLNDAERNVIVRTLAESQGNKSLAAERLGISRRTLYNKMERYGIG